jgi:predicted dehydrogenase
VEKSVACTPRLSQVCENLNSSPFVMRAKSALKNLQSVTAGRAFQNVTEMLHVAGAEAVFICTPHPLHAEPAMAAAEAGVHVMIEKPMAASLVDCDAMLRAAKKAGIILSVMSQRRFYEPVRRMKASIDAGKIGRPVLGLFLMFSWRDQAYYESDPWRGKWATEGGGCPRESIAASIGFAALVHGRHRRNQRALGQPESSVH